jgi:hypothetical protein
VIAVVGRPANPPDSGVKSGTVAPRRKNPECPCNASFHDFSLQDFKAFDK